MVNTVFPVDAVSGAPLFTGRKLRQTTVSPFVAGATPARPLGAVSGVRPGTSTATVKVTGATTATVSPFAGIIDGQTAAEAGAYAFAFDATTTVTLTAADSANPRVDLISIQLSDPAESDGTATPGVAIVYTKGTAAATPVAPSAPSRSMVLAQLSVPKSGGGNPTARWVGPFLAAAGGVLPVATLATLKTITGSPGQPAYVYADTTALNNGSYRSDGTQWVAVGNCGILFKMPSAPDGVIGNTGQVTSLLQQDVTVAVATMVEIEYQATAGLNANWAGNLFLTVNGIDVSGGAVRLGNGNQGATLVTARFRVRTILPAGTSTILVQASTDGASGGAVTYRAGQLWVWQS